MIIVESKRRKNSTILATVTNSAKDGLVKLSPFYPHYDIPVPFSEGYTATCVEAIWQGLKVFEGADVDTKYNHKACENKLFLVIIHFITKISIFLKADVGNKKQEHLKHRDI